MLATVASNGIGALAPAAIGSKLVGGNIVGFGDPRLRGPTSETGENVCGADSTRP